MDGVDGMDRVDGENGAREVCGLDEVNGIAGEGGVGRLEWTDALANVYLCNCGSICNVACSGGRVLNLEMLQYVVDNAALVLGRFCNMWMSGFVLRDS